MISGPKKTVSILLPMDLYEEIVRLARETHRTIPGYIRQIIRKYLRHIQEQEGQEDSYSPETNLDSSA